MGVTLVIPARYGSKRFPGKPLASIGGRPLIQHVYALALKARLVKEVIVATDDQRILDKVKSFGGNALMTSDKSRTGGDRLAEVAGRIDSEIYVNLQGDEVPSDPAFIDGLIEAFQREPGLEMATLKREMNSMSDVTNPNLVKVVTDIDGFAVYFSRSPIPCIRDLSDHERIPAKTYYQHLGIYIYRKGPLIEFSKMPTGLLEDSEKLEQLRFIEMGHRIKVYETEYDSCRVDTQDDLEEAAKRLGVK